MHGAFLKDLNSGEIKNIKNLLKTLILVFHENVVLSVRTANMQEHQNPDFHR